MAVPAELRHEFLQDLWEFNRDADNALAALFPPEGADGPGRHVSYDVVDYSRRKARHVAYDAPAPERPMPARAKVNYEGVTVKELIKLTAEMLKSIRDPGSMARSQRETAVARAVRQARISVDQAREWLRAQWLTGGALLSATGTVPGVADGNVYLDFFSSAADAPLGPIALGALATHIEDNVPGSLPWSSVSADIYGDLQHARAVIAADSGENADLVVLNPNSMGYVVQNNLVQNVPSAIEDIRRHPQGYLEEMWGWTFKVVGAQWPIDTETMNDAEGTEYYIPDNVVIVTVSENAAALRSLLECEPSDTHAPAGARGAFLWTDEEKDHPHALKPGVEWTGGPVMGNTDAWKVYKDVTVTA